MQRGFIITFGAIGSVLLVASFILYVYGTQNIILRFIWEELALRDGTEAMQRWKIVPQPVQFKVYIWNVTNPAEVSAGEKPILSEVGPYVYEQWLEKVNIRAEANDTLSYNLKSSMIFSETLSGGLRESDLVTVIHTPMMGMVLMVHELMPDFLGSLQEVWPSIFPDLEGIFVKTTVRELLFDGLNIDCSSKDFMVSTICGNLDANLPKTIRKTGRKDYRFSFFNHKNGTSKDTMRVFRGVENIHKLGMVFTFNGKYSINKWKDKYCDMLNGSDGSQMPVYLNPKAVVYMFQADICRSMYVKFEKEMTAKGIKLLRFVNTEDLLASPVENPSNECFCTPTRQLSDVISTLLGKSSTGGTKPVRTCSKTGALRLTPCLGAPVVLTFPHFYLGDKSFLDYVKLSPDKDRHQTLVDVEPMSGIPALAKKRVQFNMEIKQIEEMDSMANLTPGLLPVLWVEEGIELTGENLDKLKSSVTKLKLIYLVMYAVLVVGALLLGGAILCNAKRNGTLCWENPNTEVPGVQLSEYSVNDQKELATTHDSLKSINLIPNYPTISKRSTVFPRNWGNINHAYSESFM